RNAGEDHQTGAGRTAPPTRLSLRRSGGATVNRMDPIVWEREPPELRSPVLVASFSGWNDAASAAGTVPRAIGAAFETELVARIDPEEFFDFQANRPAIEISAGT